MTGKYQLDRPEIERWVRVIAEDVFCLDDLPSLSQELCRDLKMNVQDLKDLERELDSAFGVQTQIRSAFSMKKILENTACFDEKTECLTDRGHKELTSALPWLDKDFLFRNRKILLVNEQFWDYRVTLLCIVNYVESLLSFKSRLV